MITQQALILITIIAVLFAILFYYLTGRNRLSTCETILMALLVSLLFTFGVIIPWHITITGQFPFIGNVSGNWNLTELGIEGGALL